MSLVLANPAFAARGEGDNTTTTTTTVPVVSVDPVGDINSIQNAAEETAKSTNKGKQLATIVTAACAVGAAITCASGFGSTQCKLFLAGVAGGIFLSMSMGKSSGTSQKTCEGVSIGECVNGSSDGSTNGNVATIDPLLQSEYNQIDASINTLATQGIMVDRRTGKITLPNGKSISSSTLGSGSAMSAAGIDPAEFKSMMDNMQKDASKKLAAKGIDNTSDMFGDALGGGGGGGSSAASADAMGAGGSGFAQKNAGIDRDPAQVSGMTVKYNGESIGVGPDNLFKMVHRRYNLHETKGNFIGGAQ